MGLLDYLKKDKTPEKTRSKAILSDDLTDPYQVEFHLKEIIKERSFVSVTLDNYLESYSTVFLRLEKREEPTIFMDTLIPNEGNDSITKSKKITFSYVFKGKYYDFESKYLGMEKDKFIAFKVSIPQKIKKVENRQSVRVRPSVNEPVCVLSEERGMEEVMDISAGGLAFYTERIIEEGKVYDKFTFTLPPDNRKIHAPTEVLRFAGRAALSRKDKHICCVKFIDIKKHQTEMLIKYAFQRIRQITRERLEIGY